MKRNILLRDDIMVNSMLLTVTFLLLIIILVIFILSLVYYPKLQKFIKDEQKDLENDVADIKEKVQTLIDQHNNNPS